MITYVRGNIFESPASNLVNTVNTVGAMGKGIAYEFKRLYPDMFKRYRDLCERKQLKIGTLSLYRTEHKSVLNFPTKAHWRNPSKLEYIEAGLRTFVNMYEKAAIHSIAFPALGCGHGGLDFKSQVQPLMEKWLTRVACTVFIYPHRHSYQMPEHRNRKEMSEWLRTAPEELSFVEVWEDLVSLLDRRHVFRTFRTDKPYRVELAQGDRDEIRIVRESNKSLVPYDDLLDFWQQLRTFGFTSTRSAPSNRSKNASYVAPVFAELEYVEPVRIATYYGDDSDFEHSAEFALQLIPRPGNQRPESQLNLLKA